MILFQTWLLIFLFFNLQVFHASSSNAATHSAPNWLLLSPTAAVDVRRHAAHPPRYRCRRCLPDVVKLFPLRALRLYVRDRFAQFFLYKEEFSDDDYTEFDLLSTPDFAVP
ncbi:hypothetical protein C8J57DRAFT_1385408 [Mycena rebaudengoi]|nr:hypothetical protein C8J57DRAFT_1385408 [Mycena rebaudengoi]